MVSVWLFSHAGMGVKRRGASKILRRDLRRNAEDFFAVRIAALYRGNTIVGGA
jgi:hypothetical protein